MLSILLAVVAEDAGSGEVKAERDVIEGVDYEIIEPEQGVGLPGFAVGEHFTYYLGSALWVLQTYGWYILAALILYKIVSDRVVANYKHNQVYNPARVNRLQKSERERREEQVKAWEAQAAADALLMKAKPTEKPRSAKDAALARKYGDDSKKKRPLGDDNDWMDELRGVKGMKSRTNGPKGPRAEQPASRQRWGADRRRKGGGG